MSSPPVVPAKQQQNRNGQFTKTKLCRFELLGICAKGLQCPFAHGSTELKSLPDLRCTKLCKQLLSEGQCTTLNCSYAHSRDELRNVSSSKHDGTRQKGGKMELKAKAKRGTKAGPKEGLPAASPTNPQPANWMPAPPPGLSPYGGEETPMRAAALYAALAEQQQNLQAATIAAAAAEAASKEKDLYTKALAAVLQNLSSKLDLAKTEEPAYVPLRLGLSDENLPFTESTTSGSASDAMTEASNLAEEVAATALGDEEDFQDYHMQSNYADLGANQDASYSEMQEQFPMANKWSWSYWNDESSWNGQAAHFPTYPGMFGTAA